MARQKTIPRAARCAQLMQSAQAELKQSVELLGDTQKALVIWADELTPDVENLKQTAIGVQAEAIRTAIHALSMRAAAERLAVVAQLLADEGGAK
jgi:hypothetical protein